MEVLLADVCVVVINYVVGLYEKICLFCCERWSNAYGVHILAHCFRCVKEITNDAVNRPLSEYYRVSHRLLSQPVYGFDIESPHPLFVGGVLHFAGSPHFTFRI